jgi:hypothetical protein
MYFGLSASSLNATAYLIKAATGRPLSATPWLHYAERKYLEVAGAAARAAASLFIRA